MDRAGSQPRVYEAVADLPPRRTGYEAECKDENKANDHNLGRLTDNSRPLKGVNVEYLKEGLRCDVKSLAVEGAS